MAQLLRGVLDQLGSASDSYGHSGYGHSSYGHSGYGHSSHGSYGHSGYGDCCPPVVDPLTYIALLSFLAAAIYFLQQQIEMSMLMMPGKRRKRSFILEGR